MEPPAGLPTPPPPAPTGAPLPVCRYAAEKERRLGGERMGAAGATFPALRGRRRERRRLGTGQVRPRLDHYGFVPVPGSGVVVSTPIPGENASPTFTGSVGERVSLNLTGGTYPFSGCSSNLTIYKPDNSVLVPTTCMYSSSTGFFEATPHFVSQCQRFGSPPVH